MRWRLYTFAAGSWQWQLAAQRLRYQATNSKAFSEVIIRDSKWLRARNPDVFAQATSESGARGYGYWRWKPLLVLEALRIAAKRGEGVVYVDAGCELNVNRTSLLRLHEYFEMATADQPVAMRLDAPLLSWCKQEVFDRYGLTRSESLSTPVVEAGVLVLAPTRQTTELIEVWARSAGESSGFLFNDEWDPARQSPDFRAHRHDQAVLSCLMHLSGLSGIQSESYFAPSWIPNGSSFPIWAMRNRYPFSRKPGTFSGSLVTRAVRTRDKFRR